MRVETFGSPDTHWIKVTVDPSDPQVFSFKAEIVARKHTGSPNRTAVTIAPMTSRTTETASPQ